MTEHTGDLQDKWTRRWMFTTESQIGLADSYIAQLNKEKEELRIECNRLYGIGQEYEEELEQWKRPILCHWCKEGVTDIEAYEHYKSCGKHPLTARLASARAIMQKFVAFMDEYYSIGGVIEPLRSDSKEDELLKETYAEMKQWMEDE